MDKGYEVFCMVDPAFYDSIETRGGRSEDFQLARGPVPDGWQHAVSGDWLMYAPEGVRLPAQGWKIHASASLKNAEEVLSAVWDYCVANRIPFKFVRSLDHLFLRNGKYAHRGASGKFVTIYPVDEAQLELICTELSEILHGQPGPYILSDLRWGSGPLYVRYGGFAERHCIGPSGEPVAAIEDGDGNLIPDERGAVFKVPPWVQLPDCLAVHLEARHSTTVEGLPYRIERAIHFSNGGGVYVGVDEQTGEEVILKEGRPHAGLSVDRADAVARLHREREMLERLAGLELVPQVYDHFDLGDHHFLVMERVQGTPLGNEISRRYPLTAYGELDDGTLASYTGWALNVHRELEQALSAVHDRGVVIGDLHPANVLVKSDGRLALIDLEVASYATEERRQTLADPAFMAPRGVRGFDLDRYALACLRLFLFMPLTLLVGLSPEKAEELAAASANEFPVPREFLEEAVKVITEMGGRSERDRREVGGQAPSLAPDEDGWLCARDSMVSAILESATLERDDRLFPGDPKQFETNGLNFAYGAAGVLYALAEAGAGRFPEHEEWLIQRALKPESGSALGFLDGLFGIAYVLDRLGRRTEALKVLEICTDDIGGRWDKLGLDLHSGLAGMGLTLDHFAQTTGERWFRDSLLEIGEIVAARLGDEEDVPTVSGGQHPYAGLVRGSSGPALLFVRLFERTGDERFLDLATTAVGQDLRRCLVREDGVWEVDEVWRSFPYLAEGSVGIGLATQDLRRHRDNERLAAAAEGFRRAACGTFYIEPGLFWGRAGMILLLSREHQPGTAAARDPMVAEHIRRLSWHAMTFRGHLAFPGEQLMRLSMDLATGTAGVLLALGAALAEEPVQIPFLGPLSASEPMPRAESQAWANDFVAT